MGYFWINIVAGIVWFTLFLLRKDLRREIVIMSLIAMPFAVLDIFFVPSYWKPQTFMNIPVGIEGLIGSFEIGGIAAAIYPELFHKRLAKIRHYHKPISLLLLLGAFGVIMFSNLIQFSNIMVNLYIVLLIGIAFLIYVRRDLVKSTIFGGVLFAVIYFTSFKLIDVIAPINNWYVLEGLPKIFILGVPIYEILFALLFGAYWGSLYETLFGYKFKTAKN